MNKSRVTKEKSPAEITPQLVAVISAAVAATVGKRVRVTKIKRRKYGSVWRVQARL